jgi:hypothetical protein
MGVPITPNSGAVNVLIDPPSVTLATFNIVGLFSGLVLADNQAALTDDLLAVIAVAKPATAFPDFGPSNVS